MKSLSLTCLLFVIFAVFIDTSVLAKQICRCIPVEGNAIRIRGFVDHEKATISCTSKFNCYRYYFQYYCEITNIDLPKFDKCCKSYGDTIKGTWCREI